MDLSLDEGRVKCLKILECKKIIVSHSFLFVPYVKYYGRPLIWHEEKKNKMGKNFKL